MSPDEFTAKSMRASQVFTPSASVDQRRLFAGRSSQLAQIVDAVNQKGQHALLYGERGVGKTSLATVLAEFLQAPHILAPKVNAENKDTYSDIWNKIFGEVTIQRQSRSIGFNPETETTAQPLSAQLPAEIGSEQVRAQINMLAQQTLVIIIIDEFDRLNPEAKRAFADTVKMFSDYAVPATLILVGVADSVEELISEHDSVERALVQVRVPRMSHKELQSIIEVGLAELGMECSDEASNKIVHLSQGLPHYTHLLALDSVRQALGRSSNKIEFPDVENAIHEALERTQHSIKEDYHRATTSPRRESLYAQVLSACALAETDDLGFFAAKDVRDPMSSIMGRRYDIPAFSRHLNDFCDSRRGPILERTGTSHRFRFRFVDPLLQPYVIMKGLSSGIIPEGLVSGSEISGAA